MAGEPRDAALHGEVRTLFHLGVVGGSTDGQLLEQFLVADDDAAEAAFTTLVERHGTMVLHVCRQMLGNPDDAQDAFQATFLVLLRRARSIRSRESVASWLFGVALRVSRRARYAAVVRSFHERRGGDLAAARPRGEGEPSDCRAALHEEIARLPDRYREALVLCHLEGLSTAAAARRLGCAHGTILSRLARACDRLRRRLAGRGRTVPAGLLMATLLPQDAAAAAAPAYAAVQAAVRNMAGRSSLAGTVSPAVAALTHSTLRILLMKRMIFALTILATAAAVATAIIPFVSPTRGADPQAPADAWRSQPAGQGSRPQPPEEVQPRVVEFDWGSQMLLTLGASPNGKTLASAGFDGAVHLWDVIKAKEIGTLTREKSTIRSVTFSPEGKIVACVNDEGHVRLWDVGTLTLKKTFPGLGELMHQAGRRTRLGTRDLPGTLMDAIAFAPDQSLLAVSGHGSIDAELPDRTYELRIFDPRTGQLRWSHLGRGEEASSLIFSPDARILACGGWKSVKLWDARSGEPIRTLSPTKGTVFATAFTPDGRSLVDGGGFPRGGNQMDAGLVTVWNVATGEIIHTLEGTTNSVHAVVVAPDGKTFAAGGGGPFRVLPGVQKSVSEVRLWDIATGRLLWAIEGDWDTVRGLTFAPDGRSIIYGDAWVIGLIDVRTGKIERTFKENPMFSPR